MEEVIRHRFTREIMCNRLSIEAVLDSHAKWLAGEDGGRRADLSGANLRGVDLSDAILRGAILRGADLSDADLSGADVSDTDLTGANMSGTILSRENLSCAPFKIKNVHQKIYEAASRPGALDMKDWHHYCGTAHCRAGWVVTLAGDEGRALEWAYSTPEAAALIYLASDPEIGRMPDFYCDNATALADMKERAESEAQQAKQNIGNKGE